MYVFQNSLPMLLNTINFIIKAIPSFTTEFSIYEWPKSCHFILPGMVGVMWYEVKCESWFSTNLGSN